MAGSCLAATGKLPVLRGRASNPAPSGRADRHPARGQGLVAARLRRIAGGPARARAGSRPSAQIAGPRLIRRGPASRQSHRRAALLADAVAGPRGGRHRHRPGPPAAHDQAPARRRRLRQDRGGAHGRRDRGRSRTAGRADGADGNSRSPASRDHCPARRESRHPHRHPDRPRTRQGARGGSNAWRSARSIFWSAPTRCSRKR